MTTNERIAGTFVQEVPAPGRSWHIASDDNRTECGLEARGEHWTTDQMFERTVCGFCLIAKSNGSAK